MSARLILFVFLLPLFVAAAELTGTVVAVADGDTITVESDGARRRIRLYGIDAPELKQPFGPDARLLLAAVLTGETVRVEYETLDRYRRLVGRVYWQDAYLNARLVAAGYAWHYVAYAKKAKDLADAEAAARAARVGLWSQSNPTPPWQYRKK